MHISKIDPAILSPFDLETMANLHQASFVNAWDQTNLKKMLDAPQYFGFMLKDNDQLIAYTILLDQKVECEIMTIIVDPQFRNKGYGVAFLTHIIEALSDLNYFQIMLEVNVTNLSAISLYHKNGFKEVGRRKNYYTDNEGKKHDGLIFSLEL